MLPSPPLDLVKRAPRPLRAGRLVFHGGRGGEHLNLLGQEFGSVELG